MAITSFGRRTAPALYLVAGVTSFFAMFPLTPALAQRSGENAVRSAEDAFGKSIGNESIGLYSPNSVRGFSPIVAGNVRVEGLYFDSVAHLSGRLISGLTVKVGTSAQGYAFSAPTGIADYKLRLPESEQLISTIATLKSNGSVVLEVTGHTPIIGNSLSFSGGGHISHDVFFDGGYGKMASAATLLKWNPADNVEVIPFWSAYFVDADNQPVIVMGEDALPSKITRDRFMGQSWARNRRADMNTGMIARSKQGALALSMGIFRSVQSPDEAYSDLFVNVSRSGQAKQHLISMSPAKQTASTSGEARASYSLHEKNGVHSFILSVRGRDRDRSYGGTDTVDLGEIKVGDRIKYDKPDFSLGAQSVDRIKQISGGIGYHGKWSRFGELTLGLQKVSYSKEVNDPILSMPDLRTSPWLYNAGLTLPLSSRITVYGGYARGLEESPGAPPAAINLDEAPPAIITTQLDGGVHWRIGPKLSAIVGLFNIEKPYFSLDSNRHYRQLGDVRHRGAEISLTGQIAEGLNIVAGAVLLDAEVSGEAVENRSVGRRPAQSRPETFLLSADYQLPWIKGLSLDIGINATGRTVANTSNTVSTPASQIANIGARYRFKSGKSPMSVHIAVLNVFNSYNWAPVASNAYLYSPARLVTTRFTVDFQ